MQNTQFLEALQPKHKDLIARKAQSFMAEKKLAQAIESALNSLNPFPGVVGHLKFTISVDATGINVSAEQVEAPQTSVIQQPSA